MSSLRVAVIGAGRMGQGIALALDGRGAAVQVLARREVALQPPLVLHAGPWAEGTRAAELVLIAVPDDAISAVAAALAASDAVGRSHTVLHLSGLHDRTALAALGPSGAALGSFHPLQTVADPATAADRLAGAYAGVEGDPRALEAGKALARALGMTPVEVPAAAKPAYHAGAVLASNYPVALAAAAERLAAAAGVRAEDASRMYLPLLLGAAANAAALGPAAALTGPVRRGDLRTIEAHLTALGGGDRVLYRELARAALALARAAGLGEEAAGGVERLLGRY